MLFLSDISGSTMVPGFEEYVTGYPVVELESYVFAKTWYAPEMERPGCVWTHSLIVHLEDLAELDDGRQLLALFRRPEVGRLGAEKPVIVSRMRVSTGWSVEVGAGTRAVAAVYGHPAVSVAILGKDASRLLELALAMWSQQWPRLRGSFAFCTGALAPREIGGRLFDLQVAPHLAASRFRRFGQKVQILDVDDKYPVEPPRWARIAAVGLQEMGGKIGTFFSEYGRELPGERSAFAPLAEVAAVLFDDELSQKRLPVLTEILAGAFPGSESLGNLKVAVYGPSAERVDWGFSELDLLLELGTTSHWQALDCARLRCPERAADAWAADRVEAEALIVDICRRGPNPCGEAMLNAVGDNVRGEDAARIGRSAPEVLPRWVAASPALAMYRDVWREMGQYRDRTFAAALARVEGDTERASKVVAAVISAGGDDLAPTAQATLGREEAALVTLQAVSRHIALTDRWLQVVSDAPSVLCSWLPVHAESVPQETRERLVMILHPALQELYSVPCEAWARACGDTQDPLLSALVLAIGFDARSGSHGSQCVAAAFQYVYDAARYGRLAETAWRWLERYVPAEHWWSDWDRCERLARALVDKCIRERLGPEFLVRTARSGAALAQAIDVASGSRAGKRLVSAARTAVRDHRIRATAEQLQVLDRLS